MLQPFTRLLLIGNHKLLKWFAIIKLKIVCIQIQFFSYECLFQVCFNLSILCTFTWDMKLLFNHSLSNLIMHNFLMKICHNLATIWMISIWFEWPINVRTHACLSNDTHWIHLKIKDCNIHSMPRQETFSWLIPILNFIHKLLCMLALNPSYTMHVIKMNKHSLISMHEIMHEISRNFFP